jgi:hypothetical protein
VAEKAPAAALRLKSECGGDSPTPAADGVQRGRPIMGGALHGGKGGGGGHSAVARGARRPAGHVSGGGERAGKEGGHTRELLLFYVNMTYVLLLTPF